VIIVVYKDRNWQLFNNGVAEYLTSLFSRASSKGRASVSDGNRFPTYSKYITLVKNRIKRQAVYLTIVNYAYKKSDLGVLLSELYYL